MGVHVGCTPNVHGATVNESQPDRRQLWFEVKWQAGAATPDGAVQGWRSRFRRGQQARPWRR